MLFKMTKTENLQGITRERNYGLDFLKGIGILLVVSAHALLFSQFSDILYAYVCGITLNIFFVVSGYLIYTPLKINKSGVIKKTKKKFISLITPYLCFSILTILWHIIICVVLGNTEVSAEYFGWNLIARDIFCMASGIGIGTLWFLPVLFVSSTFLLIISCVIGDKNNKIKFILLGVLFIILATISQRIYNSDFSGNGLLNSIMYKYMNTIYKILNGTAYSILGYLIHMLHDNKNDRLCLTIAMFSVIISITTYITGYTICFQCTSCLSLSLICIIAFGSEFKYKLVRIFNPLIFCGQNSLAIMIYHYLFLFPIEQALIKSVCSSLTQNLQEWIFFVFNLITTLIIVYFLKDNPVHERMLGHKR